MAAALLAYWHWGEMHSVDELVRRFGSHWSEVEVEAAVWKLVGDQAAQGRLLVNLTDVELSRFTPLALLDPEAAPLLPLPSSLEESQRSDTTRTTSLEAEEAWMTDRQGVLPGPPFDASALPTAAQQAHFHRNLAALTEVLSGKSQAAVAKAYEMRPHLLSSLVWSNAPILWTNCLCASWHLSSRSYLASSVSAPHSQTLHAAAAPDDHGSLRRRTTQAPGD